MYQEPYYGCSGGCANCPRRSGCLAAQRPQAAVPAPAADPDTQMPPDNVAAAEAGNTVSGGAADASLDAFLQANPGEGVVRIQAFRGDQSIPVENVRVVISRTLGGKAHVFFRGDTNASGIIDPIVLPAPARAGSLHPGVPHPYATYDLRAEHAGFLPLETTVDVYPNIKTVQPVTMRLRLE
ncbi:MAG: hypothetical protein HFF17_06270 [Oscillospiraceae bacterium]|nr:hypothetical protein [Oscillospiraceae bacterium]